MKDYDGETPHDYAVRVLDVTQEMIVDMVSDGPVCEHVAEFVTRLVHTIEGGKDLLRATNGMDVDEATDYIDERESFIKAMRGGHE